jgi:uncharacterized tellurite resistance protein B-like protein
MLKSIRDFFDKYLAGAETARPAHTIELAAAALLVEVARLDPRAGDEVRAAVLAAVREQCHLSEEEAAALAAAAEEEARQATDYYQFTSLINRAFSPADKERLIERMWRVAYADAHLAAHELHLLRKIAGLLHVPESRYIAAKLRAKPPAAAGERD